MANPLAGRAPAQMQSGASITLQDHCDMLNRMEWVQSSGKPYFINRRTLPSGGTQLFVDR